MLGYDLRPSHDSRTIPVLLPGVDLDAIPPLLRPFQAISFRASIDEDVPFRRILAALRTREGRPAQAEADIPIENPYRGLEPFREEDRRFFFGSEKVVEELLDQLRSIAEPDDPQRLLPADARLLIVEGPSGIGKTSAVMAGLIPLLREGRIEGSAEWTILVARPGDDPWKQLADALEQAPTPHEAPEWLRGLIRRKGLPKAFRPGVDSRESGPPVGKRVLLVVDQLEEGLSREGDEKEDHEWFRRSLVEWAEYDERLLLVFVVRSGFYDPASETTLEPRFQKIAAMDRDRFRLVIERPAQRVGCEVEPGLVELLLQDVDKQPGALPLLESMLDALWLRREGRRMTVSAYRAVGGMPGLLGQAANQVFAGFSPSQQAVCLLVFLRLVRVGEQGALLPHAVRLPELSSRDGTVGPDVIVVLDQLTGSRLLSITEGPRSYTGQMFELAHDGLIEGWPVLRRLLAADIKGLRIWRRLSEAAEAWNDRNRDPSELYFGRKLDEASKWADINKNYLNEHEATFLEESQDRRWQFGSDTPYISIGVFGRRIDLSSRAVALLVNAAALFLVAGIVLTSLYIFEKSRATLASSEVETLKGQLAKAQETSKKDTMAARSQIDSLETARRRLDRRLGFAPRRLADQSARCLDTDRSLSVLLAVEALDATRPKERRAAAAEQALRNALGDSASRVLGVRASKEDPPLVLALSQSGRWLATAGAGGAVTLWDLKEENPAASPRLFGKSHGPISAMSLAPDGRFLVTASPQGEIFNWRLDQPEPAPARLDQLANRVEAMTVHSDFFLMAIDTKGGAKIWDMVTSPTVVSELPPLKTQVTSAAFEPERRLRVLGTRDGHALFTSLGDPNARQTAFGGFDEAMLHIDVGLHDHWLIAAGDTSVRIWDRTAKNPSAAWYDLGSDLRLITAVAVTDAAGWAAVGDASGRAGLWSLKGGSPGPAPRRYMKVKEQVTDLRFSSNTNFPQLAISGASGPILLVDLPNDAEIMESAYTTPTLRDGGVRLPAETELVEIVSLNGAKGSIVSVSRSSEYRWLVSAGDEYRLWPLGIESLRKLAERVAGRNLTREEWETYIPNRSYEKTFPSFPGPAN